MKKIISFMFLFTLSILLTSCRDDNMYQGREIGLFTQAVYSILGNEGHFQDTITIIEQDDYGRFMFYYKPSKVVGIDIDMEVFDVLLIAQKVDNVYVYYYDNDGFLIKEYGSGIFSVDEMNSLKIKNSWNKPLSLDRAVKKEITSKKTKLNYDKEKVKLAFMEAKDIKDKSSLDNYIITLHDINDSGKIIFFVREVMMDEATSSLKFFNAYIIGLNYDYTLINSKAIKEIKNIYNYHYDLYEFKNNIKWY